MKRERSWLPIGLERSVNIFAAFLAVTSARTAVAQDDRPRVVVPVAMVRSVDDLRRQPFIEVDGLTVRLGVESDSSYIGRGIFLYCLAEAPVRHSENGKRRGRRARLGPLSLRVTLDGSPTPEVFEYSSPFEYEGERFFYSLLCTPEAGTYRIELLDRAEQAVAGCATLATQFDPAPWHCFNFTWKGAPRSSRDFYKALPAGSGATPIPVPQRLPSLDTDSPDGTGDLVATITGGELKIAAGQSFVYREDIHFLCRWWRNGAVISSDEWMPLRNFMGAIGTRTAISFKLEIDPEAIGAIPGDQLAVQAMYAPFGWVTPTGETSRGGDFVKGDLEIPAVSNRVEFEVEGSTLPK